MSGCGMQLITLKKKLYVLYHFCRHYHSSDSSGCLLNVVSFLVVVSFANLFMNTRRDRFNRQRKWLIKCDMQTKLTWINWCDPMWWHYVTQWICLFVSVFHHKCFKLMHFSHLHAREHAPFWPLFHHSHNKWIN